jgi:hypothetical protein
MFPADSIVAHSTNCKFAPYGVSSSATAAALNKPPPPPPYPPSGVSTTSQVGTPSNKEETEDKTARRSFVLSQLTKTPALPETLSTGAQDKQPKIGDEEGEDELIDDEEEEENKNLTLAQGT